MIELFRRVGRSLCGAVSSGWTKLNNHLDDLQSHDCHRKFVLPSTFAGGIPFTWLGYHVGTAASALVEQTGAHWGVGLASHLLLTIPYAYIGAYYGLRYLTPPLSLMSAFAQVKKVCREEGYTPKEIKAHIQKIKSTMWEHRKDFAKPRDAAAFVMPLSKYFRASDSVSTAGDFYYFEGRTTRSFRKEITDAMKNLPEETKHFIRSRGTRLVGSQVPRNVFFDRREEVILDPSSHDRPHLDKSHGWHFGDQNTTIVSEFYSAKHIDPKDLKDLSPKGIIRGEWIASTGHGNTARHEIAHAIDYQTYMVGMHVPSSSVSFRCALKNDLNMMGGEKMAELLGYVVFAKNDVLGRSELFAECMAEVFGGSNWNTNKILENNFSASLKWAEEFQMAFREAYVEAPDQLKAFSHKHDMEQLRRTVYPQQPVAALPPAPEKKHASGNRRSEGNKPHALHRIIPT